MYCMHAQKGASEAPRTHFRACKISTFPGGTPPHTIYSMAPLFVFALGPHDPLGCYYISHNTLGEEECLVPTASMS